MIAPHFFINMMLSEVMRMKIKEEGMLPENQTMQTSLFLLEPTTKKAEEGIKLPDLPASDHCRRMAS